MISYNVDASLTDTVEGFGADAKLQYNNFPVLSVAGKKGEKTLSIISSYCLTSYLIRVWLVLKLCA